MKIDKHGQAKILTQVEIERLFSTGLQSDRTPLGVCLYTACRIAETCSLMVKDIYTNSALSVLQLTDAPCQHQRQASNQDNSGH
jgi:integrase